MANTGSTSGEFPPIPDQSDDFRRHNRSCGSLQDHEGLDQEHVRKVTIWRASRPLTDEGCYVSLSINGARHRGRLWTVVEGTACSYGAQAGDLYAYQPPLPSYSVQLLEIL